MGYKIYFESYEEIMSYLDYQEEFLSWETKRFTLSSDTGINMDINTAFNSGYMQFSQLKPYINKFYEDCGSTTIIVDIKLICPENYRESIDPDNYFSNFYINIYSNFDMNYVNLTYEERSAEFDEKPYKAWVAYIVAGYKKWQQYYSE